MHAFIRRPSFVFYAYAKIMNCAHIDRCVEGMVYSPKDPVADALLDAIRAGIERSDFIASNKVVYFRTNRDR